MTSSDSSDDKAVQDRQRVGVDPISAAIHLESIVYSMKSEAIATLYWRLRRLIEGPLWNDLQEHLDISQPLVDEILLHLLQHLEGGGPRL